ncbi:DUF1906 domain-containing protein, partial [Kitasatospora sp. NPDC018058]|uniref:DUF1906 domain-containing protein n=1 Tax=Kitasatospora sp. NPDC018058 TaxID=3364025 RepID=UPI0037BEF54B
MSDQHRSGLPIRRTLGVLGVTAALCAGIPGTSVAAPAQPSGLRDVAYQGHHFAVPSDWQVVDLTADPNACVHFDQHAVYLGTPGAKQDCPAHLQGGRTEALLVEPDDTAAPGTTVNPVAHELQAVTGGLRATATYDTDQALVRTILTGAGFPATAPARAHTAAPKAADSAATAAATLSGDLTTFTGKGFDACAAPDSGTMNTWRANSPYGAVGVYIGGPSMACSQPNLTASWVQQQAGAGWRFMPIYVGLQAGRISSPGSQGAAAADDAVAQASALGFGPGSVLYEDMESYSPGYSGTVLGYLSAWTAELHAKGYKSGVYSSSDSGIADLARNIGGGYTLPDVIYSARWNGAADTNEPSVPGNAWANHQRVHQYSGNVTESWGGVSINIDRDYLDVVAGQPASPTGVGVYRPSDQVFYEANQSGGVFGSNRYGMANDVPLMGHWAGGTADTVGVYRPGTQEFILSTNNSTPAIDTRFGNPGDVPLVGDWDGRGITTIGVYRPGDQTFYLSNDNATVAHAIKMGDPGDVPMVGNWSGSGATTIGVYRPSDTTFYLSNTNNAANVDHAIKFGNPDDVPIKGDWDGSGTDKVGVYRPGTSDFYGAGQDSNNVIFSMRFGNPGDTPITGHW